jgi:hypothetical protein
MANSKYDKTVAAAMAVFAKAAQETGITLENVVLPKSPYDNQIEKDDFSREADGMLMSLRYPKHLGARKCDWCQLPFMTNYRSVGCCSNYCRRQDLKRAIGIDWNYQDSGKPVWGEYEPPLVISAESVVKIEAWARKFLGDVDRIKSLVANQSQETEKTEEPLFAESTILEFDDVDLSSHALITQPEFDILESVFPTEEILPLANHVLPHLDLEVLVFDF